MQKLILTLIFFTVCFSEFYNAAAQSITISGLIRPRFELQYGYRVPPDTFSVPQLIVSQRTRLNAAYSSERFNAYLSIQDARIWGDEVLAADVPSLGVHEAWAQYNFSKKAGLKMGRMSLMYDNKRLLTNGEWPQQARAYDAINLKLAPCNGWKAEVIASYNQNASNTLNSYYNVNNYKTLDLLWVNKSKIDTVKKMKYNVSALILGDGQQSPDTSGIIMRYTTGLYGSLDFERWGLTAEAYTQFGNVRFVNQSGFIIPDSFQQVNSYMFSIGPWFEPFRNFQVGLTVDYLSGSDAFDSSNVTHMFNPTYGANDRFYGKIDWFFNMPADTRNAGLIDNYLTFRYLYKKWNFQLEAHYFLLQNNVNDAENPGTALDKKLGNEFDFSVIRDITKDININTGIAIFNPTRSMEFVKSTSISQIGGSPVTGVYVYCQLTFKPVFFSSK